MTVQQHHSMSLPSSSSSTSEVVLTPVIAGTNMSGGSDGCLTPHSALTPTPGSLNQDAGPSGSGNSTAGLVFNFDVASASPLSSSAGAAARTGVASPAGLVISPGAAAVGTGCGGSLALPQGLWTGNSNPFELVYAL